MNPPILPIGAMLLAVASFSPVLHAEVLLSESFGGAGTAPLNGVYPGTNAIRPVAWNAGTIIAANGQVTDLTNTDQGAVFDLGSSWRFKPQSTYKITLGLSKLDNAILFAGFRTANAGGGVQAQTQGTVVAMRIREIVGSDNVGIFQWPGGVFTQAAELSYTANTSASFVMEIHTNDLTDATVSVGTAQVTVDLTLNIFRYFFAGYEDPTAGVSDAKFDSVVFEGPALDPLPQLAITSVDPVLGEVSLSWATVLDQYYTLQGSEDLATWTAVDGSDVNPFAGDGDIHNFVDTGRGARYFYRLIRP